MIFRFYLGFSYFMKYFDNFIILKCVYSSKESYLDPLEALNTDISISTSLLFIICLLYWIILHILLGKIVSAKGLVSM